MPLRDITDQRIAAAIEALYPQYAEWRMRIMANEFDFFAGGRSDVARAFQEMQDEDVLTREGMIENFLGEHVISVEPPTGHLAIVIVGPDQKSVLLTLPICALREPTGTPSRRITAADIETAIKTITYMIGPDERTVICLAQLHNGHTCVGHSTVFDGEDFSLEIGKATARQEMQNDVAKHLAFKLRDANTATVI